MKSKGTIIIADDHVMFVDGLRLLIHQQTNYTVVAVAGNGKELLEILRNQPADVLLLDINMPILNGIEALKFIRQNRYKIKVIMLSTYNEAHLKEKAKSAGADGYIIKNFGLDQLTEAIQTVLIDQKSYFPNPVVLTGKNEAEKVTTFRQYNLTRRETEIIQHIKEGKTNAEISKTLFLSIYTVETHRKNIMHKLNLKSSISLMKFIVENSL